MNRTTTRPPSPVAVLSPSGIMTAQVRGNRVFVWWQHEHGSATPLRCFRNGFATPIAVVNWSPDGTLLLAGSLTGEVLAWQVRQETVLLANRFSSHLDPIVEVVCSPMGTHVAALTASGTIQVWEIARRLCVAQFACNRQATSLIWSEDGRRLATVNGE